MNDYKMLKTRMDAISFQHAVNARLWSALQIRAHHSNKPHDRLAHFECPRCRVLTARVHAIGESLDSIKPAPRRW